MTAQLTSLFVMFFAGVFVGSIIDGVRTLIAHFPKRSVFYTIGYFIELIWWAVLGGVTFYLLFLVKGGDWRAIDALAQLLGIFMYDLVFQRPIRLIGRILVNIVIRPFMLIGAIFVWVIRLIVKMSFFLFRPVRKIFKKIKE